MNAVIVLERVVDPIPKEQSAELLEGSMTRNHQACVPTAKQPTRWRWLDNIRRRRLPRAAKADFELGEGLSDRLPCEIHLRAPRFLLEKLFLCSRNRKNAQSGSAVVSAIFWGRACVTTLVSKCRLQAQAGRHW